MTGWQWLVVGAVVLACVAVGLTVWGDHRWSGGVKDMQARLEAGRLDGRPGKHSLPTRYDARELEGLPAPVQRYFRAVLKDGQPIITAVTIDMAGRFNMSPTGEQWKPFTSRQRVITQRPGFLWDASIAMLPGLNVRVVDSARATADDVVAFLNDRGLRADPRPAGGSIRVCVTDRSGQFHAIASRFLGEAIEAPELVDL